MVTSLGLNASISCAAARAGLSRAKELDYFTQWSPVNGEIGPVKGHQIPQITEGFEGEARLARILGGALSDFLSRTTDIDWTSSGLACYGGLPDPFRKWRGPDRVSDPDIRQEFLDASKSIPSDNTQLENAERLLHMACSANGIGKPPKVRMVSRTGNCAVTHCIHQATADLSQGLVRQAVIFAADSLLDESTLTWLEQTGRLKSPAVASGLSPGEAGIVLALRSTATASGAGPPLAKISACHKTSEECSLLSGKPVVGKAVAKLLEDLSDYGRRGWFVSDHNGEDYRALEWGHAIVRTKLDVLAISYPAVAFGDTGTASAGLAIATIAHAFDRRCAPSKIGIVISASESIERTCLVMEPFS